MLLKGKATKIKEITDGLVATKGVKHGKLVLTAAGKAR